LDNIRIIRTGINVSKIVKQLQDNPNDWESQKKMEGVGSLLDRGFMHLPAGVLQLVIGALNHPSQFVGDSELSIPTPAYKNHTEVINFLKRHFHKFCRCGFLSLEVGGEVGQHIDIGKYYLTKDRYHLSIQGRYRYTVGGESVIVEPGTLLWFNNKLPHGTHNIGDCTRITFVFDVPHSKKNP
jgi:hypothetical protein